MKSDIELGKLLLPIIIDVENKNIDAAVKKLSGFELDTFKDGMTEAATVLFNLVPSMEETRPIRCCDAMMAILKARDNKTNEELMKASE